MMILRAWLLSLLALNNSTDCFLSFKNNKVSQLLWMKLKHDDETNWRLIRWGLSVTNHYQLQLKVSIFLFFLRYTRVAIDSWFKGCFWQWSSVGFRIYWLSVPMWPVTGGGERSNDRWNHYNIIDYYYYYRIWHCSITVDLYCSYTEVILWTYCLFYQLFLSSKFYFI